VAATRRRSKPSKGSTRAREAFAPTAQQARYLRAVEQTGTLTAGCKAARVSPHTIYRWREDAAFAEAETIAREAFADVLEEEAIRRAWHGVTTVKPIFHQGQPVGEVVETTYSDTLLVLMLKAVRPEKYRERKQTEHTGPDGSPIEVLEHVRFTDEERAGRMAEFLERYGFHILAAAAVPDPALGAAAGAAD
jgi:hypothetical protein